MRKKILFGLIILLASIGCIVLAIFLFSIVPNVQEFTPKEAGVMTGGVMLCVLGFTGIISALVFIGTEL